MADKVRQHSVPECYLVNWTDNNLLWVYDKLTSKTRQDIPRNVAAVKKQYDLPSAVLDLPELSDLSVKALEDHYAQVVEPHLKATIASAVCIPNGSNISDELHENLVSLLLMQHVRTPAYRAQIAARIRGVLREHAGSLSIGDCAYLAFLTDPGFFKVALSTLMKYSWCIGSVTGDKLLWTSDNPVHVTPVAQTYDASPGVLWTQGLSYHFPLDPQHILILLERNHRGVLVPFEGTVVDVSTRVDEFRAQQLTNCERVVISMTDDFSAATINSVPACTT